MKPRSPTIEGFRIMFSKPAFGLAEIAWRWSFGFAAILISGFWFFEYLDTLPVGAGDLFLLRTRHPILISRAIAHILQGSGFRAGKTLFLLLLIMSAGWIVIASWGRAMTVKALMLHYREEKSSFLLPSVTGSPLGIHASRVAISVAALLSLIGAFVLAAASSSSLDSSPGSAILVFLTVIMAVFIAWSTLNWILSLAAIIGIVEGRSTLSALTCAIDLCRARWGSIAAAGTWFGLAHLILFLIASSVAMFPLGFAGVFPIGVVFGGFVVVTLIYLAAADFLYIGRMAAYVAMILPPELFMQESPAPLMISGGSVDRDEVILSDVHSFEGLIPQLGVP